MVFISQNRRKKQAGQEPPFPALTSFPAGSEVLLKPGESLSLEPHCYHEFSVPRNGRGPALIGEVSMCNDDNTDNRFLRPLERFPAIEEDEPPYRLLCTEYPPAKN